VKRLAVATVITAAVVLGGAHGCQGTDPSPNPLKACPLGQVRRVANVKPPFQYKCYPAPGRTTTHRKKKR
jgi:hypothetical protein